MMKNSILGAIAGDIIGSVYEFNNHRSKDFPLFNDRAKFTDDSVMTLAVADALTNGRDMAATLKDYGRKYPNRGYGGRFYQWLVSPKNEAYNSFGNGSAMRASAAGFMAGSVTQASLLGRMSAEVTHNHPEGIKGAKAVSVAVYMAKAGHSKEEIRNVVTELYDYDLNFTCDHIRYSYKFNETCQETVPQALVAFLDSVSYEDTIRNAISIGGDSDTIACIAGGIASAFYGGVPSQIRHYALSKLTPELVHKVIEFENFR